MNFKVGLDDGHGISTPGKRTAPLKEDIKFNGQIRKKGTTIKENEFNELIMRKVEAKLKPLNIDYIELAPTTEDTSLTTRANRANANKCDIVVSIHANALTGEWQSKAYGLTVIKTQGCQANSSKLADIMYKHLKLVDFPSNGATKYGVRVDVAISGYTLAILSKTKMPAVLLELGFMDNWEDVKAMCTSKFQDQCAEAIVKAICEYAGVKHNPSTEKFQIRVKCKEALNVRKVPDWNAEPVTTVKNGQYLDVIDRVDAKNGSTDMYKLESGLYITTSEKYVERVN